MEQEQFENLIQMMKSGNKNDTILGRELVISYDKELTDKQFLDILKANGAVPLDYIKRLDIDGILEQTTAEVYIEHSSRCHKVWLMEKFGLL